ncbi:MAG: AAA family ATPase [Melioribacteraceae bacterium]|nr:AAA family ATPase [Melioribacteraceae bacterium]
MNVQRIIIKKFRSIEKADIWVNSLNAIVGQNNSGKSSLLRALNAFFNYEDEIEAFKKGNHNYVSRSVAKIEIHFNNFESQNVPNKYINNRLIYIEVSFVLSQNGVARTIKYKKGSRWIADAQVLEIIKKQIHFILIPPNRNAAALEEVENNVLQSLIEEKLKSATINRDNYTNKFKTAVEYLENNALKNVATDTQKEYPLSNQFDIQIKYSKTISYKNYLKDVSISINELGISHPLIECGSGIQSLTIISLYNLLGKARDENIIIGLEEPETNLHPQAQKDLISYFKSLVQNGNILQFFFTTHSSNMIDNIDHTDIILFSKINDESRGFKSKIKRLPKNFFEKYSIEDFKYYQFYRYRNSEFFFSKFIVITESKNEVEVIKKMGVKAGQDYDVNGLAYLNLEGVDKAKYTIYLLKELDIPFFLVVDKDFFAHYSNHEYENSLDSMGFPLYKSEFKNEELVKTLISNNEKRVKILEYINTNHTALLDLLEEYNIVSMRYSLDLDLAATTLGQQKYYELLNIPLSERSTQELTQKRKALKKIDRILTIIDSIDNRNLPYSYSRIKKIMNKIKRELNSVYQAHANNH